MHLARKYQLGTLFLCLLLETGPPFYMVIRGPARERSREKAVPSFLRHFKTLSVGPVPGFKPATSRSTVRRWYLFGTKLPPNIELTSRYGSVHFVVVVVD